MSATPACTLAIKAIPNAPRTQIAGWLGDALKIKVHAPAVEGRANDALCAFIADVLQLQRRDVTLKSGGKSRQKVLSINGLTSAGLRSHIDTLLD